jgi:hypothetical protein
MGETCRSRAERSVHTPEAARRLRKVPPVGHVPYGGVSTGRSIRRRCTDAASESRQGKRRADFRVIGYEPHMYRRLAYVLGSELSGGSPQPWEFLVFLDVRHRRRPYPAVNDLEINRTPLQCRSTSGICSTAPTGNPMAPAPNQEPADRMPRQLGHMHPRRRLPHRQITFHSPAPVISRTRWRTNKMTASRTPPAPAEISTVQALPQPAGTRGRAAQQTT